MKNTWFILASGPSLTQRDVDRLRDKQVIAINDNYLMAPWADVLYACDPHWWGWHKDRPELVAFKGKKWTQSEGWKDDKKAEILEKHDVQWIKSKNEPGLSTDPAYINQGSNSGIQAINLAHHFGAERIVLLGYDMQATGGKKHWFGDHPNNSCPKFDRLIPFFEQVKRDADAIGLEIINATRETALTCFPRAELVAFL